MCHAFFDTARQAGECAAHAARTRHLAILRPAVSGSWCAQGSSCDAARRGARPADVCVVGDKCTGTSAVLATAAACRCARCSQYGRVVHLNAARRAAVATAGRLGRTAVFPPWVRCCLWTTCAPHLLCADDSRNILRHLLKTTNVGSARHGPSKALSSPTRGSAR